MSFKIGDTVQLKEPKAGRRFKGKVKNFRTDPKGKVVVVLLPNGLYANFPEDMWELVQDGGENDET